MQPEASPDEHPADWHGGPARRHVVALGALAAGTGLAACGGGGGATTAQAASGGAGGGVGAGTVLVKLAEVPVGGAVGVDAGGTPVVVAQPAAGRLVAHSAVCTHAGCQVRPNGAQLACPCHGSVFDAFTGAVVRGPARAPLAAVPVKVSGQDVVAG